MRTSPSENTASLVIKDHRGEQMQASAILHQDPHYLHANRISLIGTREKELELLRLDTQDVISWEEYVRTDWKQSDDPAYSHRRSGTGWLRSSGMTQGVMIADDSVQPFADIQILEAHDKLRYSNVHEPKAEYIFLQRPRDWYVKRRSWRLPETPRLAGPWRSVKQLGIRFRVLRIIQTRDDERITQERERIDLPGIEMTPIGPCADEKAFFEAADRFWFLLRVLLVFRLRQFVYSLTEIKVGAGLHETMWDSVRLEPRERDDKRSDPPFLASLEDYLARGGKALLGMEHNRELLHAAAYGYASSYNPGVMETGLTNCVEGIERMVEAFEQSRGLTRELVERKRWKKLGKAARQAATPLGQTPTERKAIERALSSVPTLSLLERITRMVKAQRVKWRKLPEELLDGAEFMIKARNDIVHGRMVEDYAALNIELLRAQSLFERLWLGLHDCGDLPPSGWPIHQIRSHFAAKTLPAEA